MLSWIVLLVLLVPVLCGATGARAQTPHTVTLDAAQEARLQALAQARGQPAEAVLHSVAVQGISSELAARGAQRLGQVQEVFGQLDPAEQAQVLALAQSLAPPAVAGQAPFPPEPTPGPGRTGSAPEIVAGLGALLLGLLGWGWETAGWLLQVLFVWCLGYLLWEARPMRRLLFGVTRRLYGRSLED